MSSGKWMYPAAWQALRTAWDHYHGRATDEQLGQAFASLTHSDRAEIGLSSPNTRMCSDADSKTDCSPDPREPMHGLVHPLEATTCGLEYQR